MKLSPEKEALARRAIATKAWDWTDIPRLIHVESGEEWQVVWCNHGLEYAVAGLIQAERWPKTWGVASSDGLDPIDLTEGEWLPDLEDRATLGVILGLIRQASNSPHAVIRYGKLPHYVGSGWFLDGETTSIYQCSWDSEALAHVDALEAHCTPRGDSCSSCESGS